MDPALVERANDLVERLSRHPRFAGTREEAEARSVCRRELERAGFECVDRPFEYSQWPGRWGIPAAAAAQTAIIWLAARMAMERGPIAALLSGAVSYVALVLASGDARRRWILRLPVQRAKAVNLEAWRGNPEVWLVAHLDSKSQTVPMLTRIVSTVALGTVTVAAAIALVLPALGVPGVRAAWPLLGVAATIAALPSLLCRVGNDSPGAVDNASGVVAVLLAAASASAIGDLGVLITSGEELALAGARIWAPAATPRTRVLNCDTVDERGRWRFMYTGARPPGIMAAVESLSAFTGANARAGRMIPGILADSMAFAERGAEAITLTRGTLSTLARIHTRRDTSNALTGRGSAEAAALLGALIKELV